MLSPLVAAAWPGYEVHFPGHQRSIASDYNLVSSELAAKVIRSAFASWEGSELLLSTSAVDIGASSVSLESGETLAADLVIDARGPMEAEIPHSATGYQKFFGLEIETERAHNIDKPILMDALVEQLDGFRFVYVLPIAANRLLVEDTRFSDSSDLDVPSLEHAVRAYIAEKTLGSYKVVRSERGVLPLPWRGRMVMPATGEAVPAGFQGGWFHPVTGYSFPLALRFAKSVAELPASEFRERALPKLVAKQRRQLGFAHRLNKMLFNWFAPEHRYSVLERFYTLPEPIIRRFYAMQSTHVDRARILIGRPPRHLSYKAALFGRNAS